MPVAPCSAVEHCSDCTLTYVLHCFQVSENAEYVRECNALPLFVCARTHNVGGRAIEMEINHTAKSSKMQGLKSIKTSQKSIF